MANYVNAHKPLADALVEYLESKNFIAKSRIYYTCNGDGEEGDLHDIVVTQPNIGLAAEIHFNVTEAKIWIEFGDEDISVSLANPDWRDEIRDVIVQKLADRGVSESLLKVHNDG